MSQTSAAVRGHLPAIVVAFVVAGALVPLSTHPFFVNDRYILANIQSDHWTDHFFAWNADLPGPIAGAWHDGVRLDRRFMRVAPSLFLSFQAAIFGQDATLMHLAGLLLHVANCLLIYHIACRWLTQERAALVAVLIGLHPAAFEATSWIGVQTVIVAATFTLLAALSILRLRETGRRSYLGLIIVCTLAATTSYEAAVGLPFLLVLWDIVVSRSARAATVAGSTQPGRLGLWFSLFATVPAYGVLMWLGKRGVDAPETAYRAPFSEVARTCRIDLVNYLVKTVGIWNPMRPVDYALHNALGEPLTLVVAALIVVPLVVWAVRRPMATLGILIFAGFLTPPLLVRATVAVYNVPSLRQIYLPLLGAALILGTGLHESTRRRVFGFAVPLVATAWIMGWVSLFLSPSLFRKTREASAEARRALAGVPSDAPLVLVGPSDARVGMSCVYDISFDWPGRQAWYLVPEGRAGLPQIIRTGERSFVARAPEGFAMPVVGPEPQPPPEARFGPGPDRALALAVPPELTRTGHQRLDEGATLKVLERDAASIYAISFTLDRALADYVFVGQGSDCGVTRIPL